MVTVVNYETRQNKAGGKFNVLVLQGGVEPIRSVSSGKLYFTARTCTVSASFDEMTCKNLIGIEFPGKIKKVKCKPYEYQIPGSDDMITINHTWQYEDSTDEIVSEHVLETAAII